MKKRFSYLRTVSVVAMSFVFLATSTLAAAQTSTPAKISKSAPQTPQDCTVPIDPSVDWDSLSQLYSEGSLDVNALEEIMLAKMSEWNAQWTKLKNDPAAKYAAEAKSARCMATLIASFDKNVVVQEWLAYENNTVDANTSPYIDGLNEANMQQVLVRIHKALVDRAMPDVAPAGAYITPGVIDSFEEKYLQLAAEADAMAKNSQTDAVDYFPYKFAVVNADLFNALSLDYGWNLSAASAYLVMPSFDTLLTDTQYLTKVLTDHFYDDRTGDLANKQKYYFAADVNATYSINTLEYVRKEVGDYVEVTPGSFEPRTVRAELGAARYDRANALLYARYIVHHQKEYTQMTYDQIEKLASDLYKRVNTMKEKKQVLGSTYFVLALQTIMTPYMADGTVTTQELTQVAADLAAFTKALRSKNPLVIAAYYNALFGYSPSDDVYITPAKLADQMVKVMTALFGPDVTKVVSEAVKDGKITEEERADIKAAIMIAKDNAPLGKNAQAYLVVFRDLINAPYETSPTADLGSYNSVKYFGVQILFPTGNEKPVYVPATAKYEMPPLGALRKSMLNVLTAVRLEIPIARQQVDDAKVTAALRKVEDVKVLAPIAAGVVKDYTKDNKLFTENGVNTGYTVGLITALYNATRGYHTPALDALYQVKVEGKSIEQVAKAMMPKLPVQPDKAMSLVTTVIDALMAQ